MCCCDLPCQYINLGCQKKNHKNKKNYLAAKEDKHRISSCQDMTKTKLLLTLQASILICLSVLKRV